MKIKRVGVLTGGGDCPGLNAVIRAVVRRAPAHGFEIVGVLNGWAGLVEGKCRPLDRDAVWGILPRGGTILGTSRTNPLKKTEDLEGLLESWKKWKLDALIAVGGEDTLGVAQRLHEEHSLNVVGVPKTIDNDLSGTDYTFGFDTAVNIVTEAIDRLHTTAESHNRCIVLEVMGRHTGWIALHGGMAGGADVVLLPEFPIDLEEVCRWIQIRMDMGRHFSVVVVAEGAQFKQTGLVTKDGELDAFGHVRLGGIGEMLARQIEKVTGIETRAVVLGHIQRGGTPTAFDRVLATRFGVAAVDLVADGKFGRMAALDGIKIVDVPLKRSTKQKQVDKDLYEVAKVFFA